MAVDNSFRFRIDGFSDFRQDRGIEDRATKYGSTRIRLRGVTKKTVHRRNEQRALQCKDIGRMRSRAPLAIGAPTRTHDTYQCYPRRAYSGSERERRMKRVKGRERSRLASLAIPREQRIYRRLAQFQSRAPSLLAPTATTTQHSPRAPRAFLSKSFFETRSTES